MNFLNRVHNRVSDVCEQKGEAPWVERLVLTDEVVATLICMPPGNSSRRHYHPDNDEFWVVMGGELVWEIEGEDPIQTKQGDVMRVPKGKAHNIVTVGPNDSLRLGIGIPDIPHIDSTTGERFN